MIEVGKQLNGTLVEMEINLNSKRKLSEVFKKYTASGDEFGFSRTHVPVELARYEGETLLSRSQAKRLLSRFNEFKEVFLDFKGVTSIGQAFADEIFRVFHNQNPNIKIVYANANKDVDNMIKRVMLNVH